MINIIVVNGVGGSGKTALENFFIDIATSNKETCNIYSMVSRVKEIATYAGWNGGKTDKDRKFLSDLKIALTEWADIPRKSVKEEIEKADTNGDSYIFIDAREPDDIDWLKEIFPGQVTTVLVDREINRKYGNIADDGVLNYQYDLCIKNTGTLDDLRASAETFYEILNHSMHDN